MDTPYWVIIRGRDGEVLITEWDNERDASDYAMRRLMAHEVELTDLVILPRHTAQSRVRCVPVGGG